MTGLVDKKLGRLFWMALIVAAIPAVLIAVFPDNDILYVLAAIAVIPALVIVVMIGISMTKKQKR